MISLFPITKIITVLASIYAALMVLVFTFSQIEDIQEKTLMAFRYAALFELVLLAIFMFGWRFIWKFFPKLNDILFPDINGTWNVEIHWSWNNKTGIKKGKLYIKQDFIKINMELITDESESETLTVQPKKNPESGRLHLFYIYRNIPKNSEHKIQPHIGTAILKSDPEKSSLLEGNYFTDRNTKGVFKLLNRAENT